MARLDIPNADMSPVDRLMYYLRSRGGKGKETFTTGQGESLQRRLNEEKGSIPNRPPVPYKGKSRQPEASLFPEVPYDQTFMEKAKEFLVNAAADSFFDPSNIGTVGLVKMPEARRMIEEITSKFRTKPSWAETRMTQYPPGTTHIDRTTHSYPTTSKVPDIHNIPYPGAFTESDLARRLGKYEEGTHHGFYTPKGVRTNLGGDMTHRGGMDELLGYQSPPGYANSQYINDLFYSNPINKAQTYDLPEMMSDTGLSRAYRTDPRIGDRNYLDFPPNVTNEQVDSIVRTFGAPPNSSMSLSPPDEIMYKLRDVDPRIYQRYSTDNLRGSGQPTSKLIEQFLGNYAQDLWKYLK